MKKADFIQPENAQAIHALSTEFDHELRGESLLRPGNTKTGTHGRWGSLYTTKGLPIHDCPNRTAACERVCYAIKFATWQSARQGMAGHYSRLAHTDTERLHALLRRDIKAALIYEPDGFNVRIHEAGDFVSAEHIGVYKRLAEEFPQVNFFGYSRAWVDGIMGDVLEAACQLPNLTVRESLDVSRPTGTGRAPVAYFGPDELKPAKAFTCPEQLGGPKCASCGLCWRVTVPVIFKQH